MASTEIRNMQSEDEYFVGTCTHIHESEEIDAAAQRRIVWLKEMNSRGLRAKVALVDGERAGFLYLIPIEICPWGPVGHDLSVIPCLVVSKAWKGKGVGRALALAAMEEAQRQGKKGILTQAYFHDFWFMPASFFEKCGFSVVQSRELKSEGTEGWSGREAILWKVFDPQVKVPRLLEPRYRFTRIREKVVVDLFWNTFCQTSSIEAQRVREVVSEFGEGVLIHEYCSDDPAVLVRYEIPRGIFVNGREISWGYEAPREGIRKAIREAMGSGLDLST